MKANGTVNGNSVTYTLETGTNVIHDTHTFDNQPLLATSRRGYLLSEGIQEGEKKKIVWFDPFSLTGRESVIEYRGKDSKAPKPLCLYALKPLKLTGSNNYDKAESI